jgi:hypothetical protein
MDLTFSLLSLYWAWQFSLDLNAVFTRNLVPEATALYVTSEGLFMVGVGSRNYMESEPSTVLRRDLCFRSMPVLEGKQVGRVLVTVSFLRRFIFS